jgi:hypothetical protein
MLQIVVSLTDKYKGIIYDRHIFIEETTGFKNIFFDRMAFCQKTQTSPEFQWCWSSKLEVKIRCQCYKTFYVRKLRLFLIS